MLCVVKFTRFLNFHIPTRMPASVIQSTSLVSALSHQFTVAGLTLLKLK